MLIFDGKKLAAEIVESLKRLPKPTKKLAAIFVGEDASSRSFLKQKEKTAKELGVTFELHNLPGTISEEELKKRIAEIEEDPAVGGVIIQLPLPKNLNREATLEVLLPEKDIDALRENDAILPPAVEAVKDILAKMNFNLKDKAVAVVGQGLLVGKPVSDWLNGKCREVIPMNSKSDPALVQKADLVITGVGKAGLIKAALLKNGAAVIDFGFDSASGKISGDLDPTSAEHLFFYTPTPGGTGPVLVAELFKNFYKLESRMLS